MDIRELLYFRKWLWRSFLILNLLYIVLIILYMFVVRNIILCYISLVLLGFMYIYYQKSYGLIKYEYIDLSNIESEDIASFLSMCKFFKIWAFGALIFTFFVIIVGIGNITTNHVALALIGALFAGLSKNIGLSFWRLISIFLLILSFFYFSWFVYVPALALTFLSLLPFFYKNHNRINRTL